MPAPNSLLVRDQAITWH